MGMESSHGQMIQVTLVSSSIITSVDKVNTGGEINDVTTALGKTTRCMAKANSLGLMGAITLETTMRTKRKVKECSRGQMVVNMTDHGRTASSME